MAKYSFKFKLNIVNDYLSDNGGTIFLVKKYGFKTNSQVIITLFNLSQRLQSCITTELSYQEVANLLKMNNPSLIENWLKTYCKLSIYGLSKQKGRPPTMTKRKRNPAMYQVNHLKQRNQKKKIEC